jgi:phosphoribosylformylglycinamidine cyclo-ligase
MNYSKAGVNIDLGNKLKSTIPNIVKNATRPEVLGKIGGFGGLFKLDTSKYKNPVLVSSTDGVGSKLKLAFKYDTHYDVAHDLVNHCVNDIIVTGAEPLFFLDYIGMNKLNEEVFNELLLDGSKVIEGDYIIGLQSNGLHTNGYTLARKALGDSLVDKYAGELLSIHLSYLQAFNACRQFIKAAAHITGGGLIDNIPRTLPPQFKAVIQKRSWTVPDIFKRIQSAGDIPEEEMYKVFNMGIGMTWIVSVNDVNHCVAKLSEHIPCTIIGRIEKRNNNVVLE